MYASNYVKINGLAKNNADSPASTIRQIRSTELNFLNAFIRLKLFLAETQHLMMVKGDRKNAD
jgi:hypothetical protein